MKWFQPNTQQQSSARLCPDSSRRHSQDLIELTNSRLTFIFHPVHAVCYILDPKYAIESSFPRSKATFLIEQLHAYMGGDNAPISLVSEIASYFESITASKEARQSEDIWSPQRRALLPSQWWVLLDDVWPCLARLARRLFQLPASAAAAERVWSAAGNIISKSRNRLKTTASNSLLSIYWNTRALNSSRYPDQRAHLPSQPLVPPAVHVIDCSLLSKSTAIEEPDDLNDHISESEDDDNDSCEDDDNKVHNAAPIQTQRQYSGSILEFSPTLLKTGTTIAMFFPGRESGWYEGTIIEEPEEDEPTSKYAVEFKDGWTPCKLTKRGYDRDYEWVVPP